MQQPEKQTSVSADGETSSVVQKEQITQALDQLFTLAKKYQSSPQYYELIKFVSRFRFYSPFNAMLIHVQLPGATYAASASRWVYKYKRTIKETARPLVILQPMGPVMFVFDVGDTEEGPQSRPLPVDIEDPFKVRSGTIGKELDRLIENAKRDGIRIDKTKQGSQSAGSIQPVEEGKYSPQPVHAGRDDQGVDIFVNIPVRYFMLINSGMGKESQFVTMLHEFAHLYCGHLGTRNQKWWPDRSHLSHDICELEAESIACIVSARFGIDNPSEKYLSGFVDRCGQVPDISLECIMKSAGLIEKMCRSRLKPRK